MAANPLAPAVRRQLGIGRVLPLGGPADGSWITERAAAGALRAAVGAPAGLHLGSLRLTVADPGAAPTPAVPPPPSALPPGPLRLTADFAAPVGPPLPDLAEALRAALLAASDRLLGLVVGPVDLRVTELLTVGGPPAPTPSAPPPSPEGDAAPDGRTGATEEGPAGLAATVRAVPGVARLAPALGGRSRPVRLTGGHALVQLATAPGHRALDVARAVRAAAAGAPYAPETVAVLVTAVGPHG